MSCVVRLSAAWVRHDRLVPMRWTPASAEIPLRNAFAFRECVELILQCLDVERWIGHDQRPPTVMESTLT